YLHYSHCSILIDLTYVLFFFFSSRRRHTSSYGDWSSDVCSSDLGGVGRCRLEPEGILAQGFEPTPSYAACSTCDFRIICPAAERSEERRVGNACGSLSGPESGQARKHRMQHTPRYGEGSTVLHCS